MKEFQPPTHPSAQNSWSAWMAKGLIHVLTTIAVVPITSYYLLFRRDDFLSILHKARKESVKMNRLYQDQQLIQKVSRSPVMQAYIQGGLEHQLREGYCSAATIRCMLKSIPSISLENIPPMKGGASIPTVVQGRIDGCTNGITKTSIVYGSEGYESFLNALKKSNDLRYRVAVNFLRSPLFGYISPWFVPFHFILAFFGGHFSVVVGYLEEEDLVAIFDVNHTYGGIYFIESKRLFDAINTVDLSVKNKVTRALLVTEIRTDDKLSVK
jgi:hypothetical protein